MPPAKRRKTRASTAAAAAAAAAQDVDTANQPDSSAPTDQDQIQAQLESKDAAEPSQSPDAEAPPEPAAEVTSPIPPPTAAAATASTTTPTASNKAHDRLARLRAIKARAKTSSEENFKAATREAQRAAEDPAQLAALQRKHAVASHKLLKADVEEAGGDFERKRAWDWTVDESEAWDRRVKKNAARHNNAAFADYTTESNKVYKKQLRQMQPDMERYENEKAAAIERAAAAGGLDIVETEDGELIAVDRDGSFYSTSDSTTFAENRPDRAAVDRLVEDLRKAEEQRLKKRRERMAKDGDDGDVTYINEKNKQFNKKLSRFYDKYTADLRESFERGTMI